MLQNSLVNTKWGICLTLFHLCNALETDEGQLGYKRLLSESEKKKSSLGFWIKLFVF